MVEPSSTAETCHLHAPQLKCAQEIKEFEEKFEVLTDDVLNAFNRGNVSLNKIKRYLRQLPVSLKLECSEFLQSQASRLARASSTDELFWILSAYWDFMNPNLLVNLTYRFGDDQTITSVDKYMEELKKFRMRTKLKDFVNQWTGQPKAEFQEIVVVLSDDWNERTLQQLEEFRNGLSRKRWLENHVLQVDGIKKGCVAATFSLPKAIDSQDLELESLQSFFQENQILRVFLNGVPIISLQVYLC